MESDIRSDSGGRKVAIMQPYFFPYVGFFQLIQSVDLFIVYDNIKYTKKGWINRNRVLQSGKDMMFTLPLKHGSDSLDVRDRELATEFDPQKMLRQISNAYRRAPHFSEAFSLIEQIMRFGDHNLFKFILNSIVMISEHLGIKTEIRVSSEVSIDHELKGQAKVLALCQAVGANTYINAIGGLELYSREAFKAAGIDLKFIKSRPFEYTQFDNEFVPWLSIIDVMMFNPPETIRRCIGSNYDLF
jgi:hypothetical protein